MKRYLKAFFSALTLAAFCLPAAAQEDSGQTFEEGIKAEQPAEPAKKKTKRKKKPEPPSEYKFTNEPETPTYKFDKHAEPIVKPAKKKKKKKAKAEDSEGGGGSGQGLPKLKKVKSFNDPDTPAEGAGGVKLPPGVKIPGMGGN